MESRAFDTSAASVLVASISAHAIILREWVLWRIKILVQGNSLRFHFYFAKYLDCEVIYPQSVNIFSAGKLWKKNCSVSFAKHKKIFDIFSMYT